MTDRTIEVLENEIAILHEELAENKAHIEDLTVLLRARDREIETLKQKYLSKRGIYPNQKKQRGN